jgi:HlyD family secretion protein
MATKRKKRWLKIVIPIAAVCLIGGLIAANMMQQREHSTEVMTIKAKRGRLVQTVPGTGRVQPEVQVKISANVSAKITGIFVEEGDRVNTGDLLVTLDKERYQAAMEQAVSALKSANAALEKSKSELGRIRELYQRGMSSEADLETAQADFEYRSAEVERSSAYLKQARDDLSKTSIFSPMDGVVSQLNKEPGEMALGAQYQQDIILVVADLNKMEVVVEVDENDIVDVSLQDTSEVEIDAYPDTTFVGVVREIAHTATTRGMGTSEEVTNFVVKIRLLDVPQSLRPGMSATADVVTDVREDALYIPIQCVVMKSPLKENPPEEGESETSLEDEQVQTDESEEDEKEEMIEAVFRVDEGKAHQTAVVTGISSDTDIEIISGLDEGDTVVSGPFRTLTQRLKDDDSVKERNKHGRSGEGDGGATSENNH